MRSGRLYTTAVVLVMGALLSAVSLGYGDPGVAQAGSASVDRKESNALVKGQGQ
jgi:hypothetical protein